MSQPPKQCLVRHYLIDPYEIHYLRFIVEAYPGIGVVSTTTPRSGLYELPLRRDASPWFPRYWKRSGKTSNSGSRPGFGSFAQPRRNKLIATRRGSTLTLLIYYEPGDSAVGRLSRAVAQTRIRPPGPSET